MATLHGPFMSSFAFDVSLMSGIVDLGGERKASQSMQGRCVVARQVSSAQKESF